MNFPWAFWRPLVSVCFPTWPCLNILDAERMWSFWSLWDLRPPRIAVLCGFCYWSGISSYRSASLFCQGPGSQCFGLCGLVCVWVCVGVYLHERVYLSWLWFSHAHMGMCGSVCIPVYMCFSACVCVSPDKAVSPGFPQISGNVEEEELSSLPSQWRKYNHRCCFPLEGPSLGEAGPIILGCF